MPNRHLPCCTALTICLLASSAAVAGQADIVGVNITPVDGSKRLYRFDVSVRHEDSGWDHYADRWEIVAPDGTILGTRVLLHPHETEQPFTRSLDRVLVPAGIAQVTVRAHDKVHGLGGKTMSVAVPD